MGSVEVASQIGIIKKQMSAKQRNRLVAGQHHQQLAGVTVRRPVDAVSKSTRVAANRDKR